MDKKPLKDYKEVLNEIGFGVSGDHQVTRSAPVVKAIYEAEDCRRELSFAGIIMRGEYLGEVKVEEDVKKTLTIERAHIRLMNVSEGLRDLVNAELVTCPNGIDYKLSSLLRKTLKQTFDSKRGA